MKTEREEDLENYITYLKSSDYHKWVWTICLIISTIIMTGLAYHYFTIFKLVVETCK